MALSQNKLGNRVDAAGWAVQLALAVDKATLQSEATPGTRAFLTCVPTTGRTKMDPEVHCRAESAPPSA